MGDLNQYAISKVLGSTMKPIQRAPFRQFRVTGDRCRKPLGSEATPESGVGLANITKFSYPEDALVVRAFEEVREGTQRTLSYGIENLLNLFTSGAGSWASMLRTRF